MPHEAVPPGLTRRSTSYDVARLAGVSQSAVSRCFRDGSSLSADKRARIEAAAQALGYLPNKMARSLITQRSNIIGVLVAEVTTRSFPGLLLRLGDEIQASGRRMLVFTVSDGPSASACLPDILAYHVDGLIAGVSLPAAMLQTCAASRIPVVLYNRSGSHDWASSVGCDDTAALSALVNHLRAGGTRRIDFIAGPADAPVSQSRLMAARRAAKAQRVAFHLIAHTDYSHEAGRAAVLSHVASGAVPDTIVCANDTLAMGAIDACRTDLQLDVPGDVAVAGYDDVPQAAWPPYALTTLAQPLPALSQAAVAMITAQLDATGLAGEQRLMPARLMIRGSTRRPAA